MLATRGVRVDSHRRSHHAQDHGDARSGDDCIARGWGRGWKCAGDDVGDVRAPEGQSNAWSSIPPSFTTRITNPWWPMRPGNRWVYRETAPNGTRQRVVVTVLDRSKRIANGVTARVVRDVVTADGNPVEVTDDWYAQDRCGNVWYLGEATTEYENGKPVSTSGSFEAGVDGAQAGVLMPARPTVGMRYRQEYYAGEAEDRAEVVSLGEQVEVPFGHFRKGRVLDDPRPEPARAEGPGVQVLRPGNRASSRHRHLRRKRS